MTLEMKQQEYIDDRINNKPVNINFSKTLKSVIENAKTRADKDIKEANDIKEKIKKDDNLSKNKGIQDMIIIIDPYLNIVADNPATKTYYLNALEDMLENLNTLINKMENNNNTNKITKTDIKDNIKNSEQSNEWWLKALIADDKWMEENKGINKIQLK